MLHDLTRWLLYSPRRLVAAAAVVLGAASVAWIGLAPDEGSPEASPSKRAAPSAAPSVTGPTTSAVAGERPDPSRVVMSVARRFLAQYVVPPSARVPEAAPRGLQALTTPALWKGLRLTHADAFPRGSVRSIELKAAGPYSGTVLAEFTNGAGITLSVVAWQRGWRVGDVRPTENS